jgi:hypothetical protein
MNRFEGRANARSSTTLPSTALNRFAMTEMIPISGRCSGKMDSCDSLRPRIPPGSASGRGEKERHFQPGLVDTRRLGWDHQVLRPYRERPALPTAVLCGSWRRGE